MVRAATKVIELDAIMQKFDYDEESPSGFKRKVDWWCGNSKNRYLREAAGTFVSSKDQGGYYILYFEGKHYLAHRVVATLHNLLSNPEDTVDHIDGNILNNLPNNLRCVPRSVNSRNRKMPNTNSSGVMGVCINRTTVNGYEYVRWTAQWKDKLGKSKFKGFSILKYGNDGAFRLACEWRNKMIEQRNEEGASYSERHGETNE